MSELPIEHRAHTIGGNQQVSVSEIAVHDQAFSGLTAAEGMAPTPTPGTEA